MFMRLWTAGRVQPPKGGCRLRGEPWTPEGAILSDRHQRAGAIWSYRECAACLQQELSRPNSSYLDLTRPKKRIHLWQPALTTHQLSTPQPSTTFHQPTYCSTATLRLMVRVRPQKSPMFTRVLTGLRVQPPKKGRGSYLGGRPLKELS